MAEKENNKPERKSFSWYFYWKFDRTVAILGIIAIAIITPAITEISGGTEKILSTALGALAVYIGSRSVQ